LNGDCWIGPNAVPAFAREGYSYSQINVKDLLDVLTFPGFFSLGIKNLRYGLREIY